MVALGRGDDGGVWLSVTDQGVGIPPVQREVSSSVSIRITARATSRAWAWAYSITRQILELHGGAVHIEASEQRGTRSIVTLPPQATHESN